MNSYNTNIFPPLSTKVISMGTTQHSRYQQGGTLTAAFTRTLVRICNLNRCGPYRLRTMVMDPGRHRQAPHMNRISVPTLPWIQQNTPRRRGTGAPWQDSGFTTSLMLPEEGHIYQPAEGLHRTTHYTAPCMEGSRQGNNFLRRYEQEHVHWAPSLGSPVGWASHGGTDATIDRERSSAQPPGRTGCHCWHVCNPQDCMYKLIPLATWHWER